MRCSAARRLLVAYQDEELAPADAARVAEHLHHCAACAAAEAELSSVTPEPLRLAMPDWSQLDAALDAAWEHAPPALPAPANSVGRRFPYAIGLYALAVGLLVAWGVHNHQRANELQVALTAAQIAPPPAVPMSATALQPASFKPPADDGKPR